MLATISPIVCLAALLVPIFQPAYAAEWMVRRQTTSGICHVQLRTAAPIGVDLTGPHASEQQACSSAKTLYDGSELAQKKCSGYGKGTVNACARAGVKLP